MTITLDGTAGMTAPVGAIYNGLQTGASVSASGTSVDFTGIPIWVKRITIMFSGVSTNGTSNYLIQIGSGSIATSGYNSASSIQGSTNTVSAAGPTTTGFVSANNSGANAHAGAYTITNITGNTWVLNGSLALTNTNYTVVAAGNAALSGVLDRVRITTVGGTDTFDAGTINIMYE